jgi:hypothetical protein
MKTIIRLTSIIILVIFCFSCASKKGLTDPKTVILPLGDTIPIKDGSLVYGLPMTVFNVTVEVEKRMEKPGPYAKFAGDMLGIKDVITQEKESWIITGLKLYSSEELDPSEFYVIESNTLFQTNVLSLKRAGLILDLNPDIYEKPGENRTGTGSQNIYPGFMDLGADEYYVTQSDTAFRVVKLDTAFIKIPYLVERKKQLSIDQLAEKAAKTLLEYRDGKHLIMTGEANVFPQDKSAIDEMNRLEDEYLALFAGKSWTVTKTFSYTMIPQKDMAGKQVVLFRFSDLTGISDAGGKSGIPVTLELTPARKTKNISVISKPVPENAESPKYDKLYYRVPDVVTVKVKTPTETMYNSRKLIYQFGDAIQLPANYIIGR